MTFSSGDGALSVTTRRCLISVAIDPLLERFDADAMHHVDEALNLALAPLQITLDQALDDIRHLRPRERRAENLAKRGLHAWANLALISADFNLVPLLAVLIDAQNADVAYMVVAARVHAAGDIEVQLADVMQVIEIVEAPLDGLGHRDRLGIGERAEVAAWAGDDVRQQAEVRRRKAELPSFAPYGDEIAPAHI